ncbi:MAG: chorismate synthase [Candidatus Sumerlaeaceae bacterium]|nr:chorismate synthase [Candidatus Sumerlaeaceae bacterium]
MKRLDYLTAGESHGPQLTAIIRGVPAGLYLSADYINRDLARRQQGYGRGARMKIEKDTVQIVGGVRKGYTLGSPIALVITNQDYQVWREQMDPEPGQLDDQRVVTRPRPGHADLPGVLKFGQRDARNILERASARETAARVAVGSICRRLLEEFGISIFSHVVNIGGIRVNTKGLDFETIRTCAENSDLRVARPEVESQMKELIRKAKENGDTVGGVYEVIATGVPVGLGNTMNWDEKLDARLAYGLMSCQAIKGVSVGMGFDVADNLGSSVHDPIAFTDDPAERERLVRERGRGPSGGFFHLSNNAGGIEGGMSNGEPIIVRAVMKPIATLMRPLQSVDLKTKDSFEAVRERSDVCAVPAAAVVGEAIVAFVLAQAFLEKFGGDSVAEIKANYCNYIEYLDAY